MKADLFVGVKIPNCSLYTPLQNGSYPGIMPQPCAPSCRHVYNKADRPNTASMSPLTLHLQSWHHYCTALPQRLFLSNQLRKPCHHRNHQRKKKKKKLIIFCDKVTNIECKWQSLRVVLKSWFLWDVLKLIYSVNSTVCAVEDYVHLSVVHPSGPYSKASLPF